MIGVDKRIEPFILFYFAILLPHFILFTSSHLNHRVCSDLRKRQNKNRMSGWNGSNGSNQLFGSKNRAWRVTESASRSRDGCLVIGNCTVN